MDKDKDKDKDKNKDKDKDKDKDKGVLCNFIIYMFLRPRILADLLGFSGALGIQLIVNSLQDEVLFLQTMRNYGQYHLIWFWISATNDSFQKYCDQYLLFNSIACINYYYCNLIIPKIQRNANIIN